MTQDFTKMPHQPAPQPSESAPPPFPPNPPASSVSALAIVSLVLAISGFFCLGFLTFLPAVICGHIALSKIKRSGGALGGRAMALVGTIVGYIGLLLSLLFIPFLLWKRAIPAQNFGETVVPFERQQDLSHLRQIAMACIIYIDDHDGQAPPDLSTALTESDMDTDILLDDDGNPRYELLMEAHLNAVRNPAETPMVKDLQSGATAYADGHVER